MWKTVYGYELLSEDVPEHELYPCSKGYPDIKILIATLDCTVNIGGHQDAELVLPIKSSEQK